MKKRFLADASLLPMGPNLHMIHSRASIFHVTHFWGRFQCVGILTASQTQYDSIEIEIGDRYFRIYRLLSLSIFHHPFVAIGLIRQSMGVPNFRLFQPWHFPSLGFSFGGAHLIKLPSVYCLVMGLLIQNITRAARR